jgi:hypothetical protein
MNTLYAEGKGKVFQQMMSWLSSGDEDLQITGVLAMGNFARTGKYQNNREREREREREQECGIHNFLDWCCLLVKN